MRRVWRLLLIIVVGVLAWEFVPVRVLVWDGSFDLTVRVECPAGLPRSVRCEAFGWRENADEAVTYLLPPNSPSWSAVADPFDGQPIHVRVAVSGRESPFGRELHRSQFRFLAVIAVLPDGHSVGKAVDIPDGRVSREVSVTLP